MTNTLWVSRKEWMLEAMMTGFGVLLMVLPTAIFIVILVLLLIPGCAK